MAPPTPERFQNRNAAATVASIDLFFVFLNVIIFAILVIFVGYATFDQSARSTAGDYVWSSSSSADWTFLLILWTIVIVYLFELGIYIIAVKKLLESTRKGVEPKEALKGALFWRVVTIVFAAQNLIFAILSFRIFSALITIIVRGLMLYRVTAFIDELEKVVKEEGHNAENPGVGDIENQLIDVNLDATTSSEVEKYKEYKPISNQNSL